MFVIEQAAKTGVMSLSDWIFVLGVIRTEAKIKRRTLTERVTKPESRVNVGLVFSQ